VVGQHAEVILARKTTAQWLFPNPIESKTQKKRHSEPPGQAAIFSDLGARKLVHYVLEAQRCAVRMVRRRYHALNDIYEDRRGVTSQMKSRTTSVPIMKS
jgi:hypothetical protein